MGPESPNVHSTWRKFDRSESRAENDDKHADVNAIYTAAIAAAHEC